MVPRNSGLTDSSAVFASRHSSRASGLLNPRGKKYSTSEIIYFLFKSPLRAVSSGKIQGFPLTASKQALIYVSPIELNCDIGIRNLLVQRPKKPKINPSSKREFTSTPCFEFFYSCPRPRLELGLILGFFGRGTRRFLISMSQFSSIGLT